MCTPYLEYDDYSNAKTALDSAQQVSFDFPASRFWLSCNLSCKQHAVSCAVRKQSSMYVAACLLLHSMLGHSARARWTLLPLHITHLPPPLLLLLLQAMSTLMAENKALMERINVLERSGNLVSDLKYVTYFHVTWSVKHTMLIVFVLC
jgi:hypothetical protein